MKIILLRTLGYTLATLGFFLGFTSKVLAQYGAWIASYRYNGFVKTELCDVAIKGIRVSLQNKDNQVYAETYTDETGRFNISMWDGYPVDSMSLCFNDTDGVQNEGLFNTYVIKAIPNGRNNADITLAYAGINPCLPIPEEEEKIEDSLFVLEPEITPSEPNTDSSFPTAAPLEEIIVYPNPSTDLFNVAFELKEPSDVLLEVYSLTGQCVLSEKTFHEAGSLEQSFTLSGVSTGSYMLVMQFNNKKYSAQIILH